MHAQEACAFIDKIAPSLTNLRELAPPKSDIPFVVVVQSIIVEYIEEYIIVQQMDSRILYIATPLRCWRWQS